MVWSPNVTVASVIERDGQFLLVEENIHGNLVINQPAGHLEEGETLIEAAIRETLEETGWRFLPKGIVGVYRWQSHKGAKTFLRITFWGSCHDFDPDLQLDQGIIRALWMSRDELLAAQINVRSPLVLHAIDDFQRGQRYPLSLLVDLEGK